MTYNYVTGKLRRTTLSIVNVLSERQTGKFAITIFASCSSIYSNTNCAKLRRVHYRFSSLFQGIFQARITRRWMPMFSARTARIFDELVEELVAAPSRREPVKSVVNRLVLTERDFYSVEKMVAREAFVL